ncbi:hypothetical protein GLW08_03875 [Pontibacillus yanchengensis]|uniref:Uncharacterized protein n=2 Tax=Pontibacillus yanchengensis TaxID=462910 RepID=A0ACC7VCS8_9BACI|nr:hypothetical protein [Pontibacillus yanchengensis]MYL35158.1 hypothetical protein [Pontibacillus yanchengensis]MYL52475.1 hypothetical protein [Pontibacillus yanchengensis]
MKYDLYIRYSNVQNDFEKVRDSKDRSFIMATDFSMKMDDLIDGIDFLMKQFPFIVVSEDELVTSMMQARELHPFTDIKVEIPIDTEAIYCLSLSNLHEYEVVYLNASSYPQQSPSIDEKVATIQKEVNTHHRVLVLIQKVKAFLNHFNPSIPRLYEVELENGGIRESELLLDQPINLSSDVKIAIIVHGFLSASERNFEALKKEILERNHYDKVIGYSYATTHASIVQHGKKLYEVLCETDLLQEGHQVDIYAHSLGGLLTRSMINHEGIRVCFCIHNVVLAGVPNLGTPLAQYGNQLFSEEGWNVAELLFHIVRDLIQYGEEAFPIYEAFLGEAALLQSSSPVLADMSPHSLFIRHLNQTTFHITGQVFLIGYCIPETGDGDSFFMKSYRHFLHKSQIFQDSKHDGVIPYKSSSYRFLGQPKPIVISEETPGWHTWYFSKKERVTHIVDKVLHSP